MFVKRDKFLPIAVPDISEKEIYELIDTLKSGWISVGPKVKEFQRRFAKIHSAKYALAVNSATSALFVGAKCLGIGAGDKVVVPAITWPSTANIAEQLGAEVVFCDVNPKTCNMEADTLRKILDKEEGVKLVLPVHMSGLPVDIDEFEKIRKERGVHIIYDAAHAVFSEYKSRRVGSFGTASCFSFYATKNITAGDGGIITTDNSDLYEQMELWAYHGMNKDSWKRYSEENSSPHVQSLVPGFKFNMTDLNAALALAQLERFDELLNKRNDLFRHYYYVLGEVEEIALPVLETEQGRWGNHVFSVKLQDDSIDRDLFMNKLKEIGIGTNIHFYPVHKHAYYRKKYGDISLGNAEFIGNRSVSLPLCTKYTREDIEYVAQGMKKVIRDIKRGV